MCLQLLRRAGSGCENVQGNPTALKREAPDFEGDQPEREGGCRLTTIAAGWAVPAERYVPLASLSGRLCAPTLQRDPLTDELLACAHGANSVQ